jgi:hypothetical protein
MTEKRAKKNLFFLYLKTLYRKKIERKQIGTTFFTIFILKKNSLNLEHENLWRR